MALSKVRHGVPRNDHNHLSTIFVRCYFSVRQGQKQPLSQCPCYVLYHTGSPVSWTFNGHSNVVNLQWNGNQMKENPLPTLFHTVSNKGNTPWASNVPYDTGNVLISLLLGILVNTSSQPQQLDKTAICTKIYENILYDIQYKLCKKNTFRIDVRIVRHKFAYYGSPFWTDLGATWLKPRRVEEHKLCATPVDPSFDVYCKVQDWSSTVSVCCPNES